MTLSVHLSKTKCCRLGNWVAREGFAIGKYLQLGDCGGYEGWGVVGPSKPRVIDGELCQLWQGCQLLLQLFSCVVHVADVGRYAAALGARGARHESR